MNIFEGFCDRVPPYCLRTPPYVLLPTEQWRRYVGDMTGEDIQEVDVSMQAFIIEYVEMWLQQIVKQPPQALQEWSRILSLPNVVMWLHKHMPGRELDAHTKKKLAEAFSRLPEALLTGEGSRLQ